MLNQCFVRLRYLKAKQSAFAKCFIESRFSQPLTVGARGRSPVKEHKNIDLLKKTFFKKVAGFLFTFDSLLFSHTK